MYQNNSEKLYDFKKDYQASISEKRNYFVDACKKMDALIENTNKLNETFSELKNMLEIFISFEMNMHLANDVEHQALITLDHVIHDTQQPFNRIIKTIKELHPRIEAMEQH